MVPYGASLRPPPPWAPPTGGPPPLHRKASQHSRGFSPPAPAAATPSTIGFYGNIATSTPSEKLRTLMAQLALSREEEPILVLLDYASRAVQRCFIGDVIALGLFDFYERLRSNHTRISQHFLLPTTFPVATPTQVLNSLDPKFFREHLRAAFPPEQLSDEEVRDFSEAVLLLDSPAMTDAWLHHLRERAEPRFPVLAQALALGLPPSIVTPLLDRIATLGDTRRPSLPR